MDFLLRFSAILGGVLFIWFLIWAAVRAVRWAKRKSMATDLLGLGIGIPAAGVNPQPPPQLYLEEMSEEIQGRKSSDTAGPDK